MAKDKTLDLTIKIAGQVDKSLLNAIGQTQNSVSSLSKNLSKIGTAGLAAMGALATGTVAAIVQCTNVAEEFESNMSDVVKYVSGLADATGEISDAIAENGKSYAENYSDAKKAILDLSTQIPYTAEELTKLAAAAGQSGYSMEELFSYDSNGNVQGFLKDVAEWGVAMDIDAEQAGDWAAKWEVAFGMTHDEVMELADIINYLGANSATTAAEIAQVVNETVSMGDMAGVDSKTTVAIADAMLAMGVSADSAGTSIKRMYTNLSKGYAASSTIQTALGKLGMTAEGVAESMQVDGTQTLLDILQGIKELPESEQLATVSSLFGQCAVEGGGKLVENIEVLESALEAANDSSLYSGSMEREFIIKSSTAESIDTMMSNSWYALQEEIGEEFLPVKKQFSLMMIDVIDTLRNNMPQLEQIAESMATILSGGVEKLGQALEDALPYIQQGLDYVANNGDKVASIIGGLAAAFATMKAAPLIETVLGGAGSLLFGTSTSYGKKKGGLISSLLGLGGSASKTVSGIGSGIKNTATGVASSASGYAGSILSSIGNIGNTKIGGMIGSGLSKAGSFVTGGLSTIGSGLAGVGSKIAGGAGNLVSLVASSSPGQAASSVLSGIGGAASTAGSFLGSILNVGTTVLSPVTSMFGGILSTALPIVGVIGSIIAVLGILYDNVDGLQGIFVKVFGSEGFEIFETFKNKLTSSVDFIEGLFNGGLSTALLGFRQKIVGGYDDTGEKVNGIFGTLFNTDLVAGAYDGIVSVLQSILGVIGQVVSFARNYIQPIIEEIFSYITGTVMPIILQVVSAAAPIVSQIITNIGTAVMTVAQIIATAIQAALPVIEGIITTVLSIASVVVPAALAGFNALWEGLSSIIQSIQQIFNGVIEFITGVFTGDWETAWTGVKDIFGGIFDTLAELIKTPINAVIAIINGAIENINALGITIPDWVPKLGGKTFSLDIPEIPQLAKGGFTNGPSIAGEAGTEAVISFASGVRSQNIDTWAQAGRMLGLDSLYSSEAKLDDIDTDSSSYGSITFAPQITIQGNADESTVDQMVTQMKEMFEQMMEQYTRQRGRVALSR